LAWHPRFWWEKEEERKERGDRFADISWAFPLNSGGGGQACDDEGVAIFFFFFCLLFLSC